MKYDFEEKLDDLSAFELKTMALNEEAEDAEDAEDSE